MRNRILFIAPWTPGPMRPRSFGILKSLCSDNDVWFLGLAWPDEDTTPLHSLPLAGYTHVPSTRLGGVLRAGLGVASRNSLQVAYVNSPAWHVAVREIVERWRPDIAHMNVLRSAAVLDELSGVPVVYDLDEIRSEYYAQLGDRGTSLAWRLIGRAESRRMKRLESTIINRATTTLVSSPTDLAPDHPGIHLVRSPHQVGATASAQSGQDENLLFVGRMSYGANVEGLLWFLDEVFPHLLEVRPSLRCDVVGESPPRALLNRSSASVVVHGRVEDLDFFYSRATLAIVPVRMGTGVQMKLIQALAAGVPTVTTSDCLRRAGIDDPQVAISADTAAEWVSAIDDALDHSDDLAAYSRAGKEWAETHYSREAIDGQLARAYEHTRSMRLVAEPGRGSFS